MKKRLPIKNKHKIERVSSLSAYIIFIFIISLLISLISFKLFWDSPARELAIEIQKATEEEVENPFLAPSDNDEINAADGNLRVSEVDQLLKQAKELTQELSPQQDFKLGHGQSEELFELLEF